VNSAKTEPSRILLLTHETLVAFCRGKKCTHTQSRWDSHQPGCVVINMGFRTTGTVRYILKHRQASRYLDRATPVPEIVITVASTARSDP